MFRLLIWSSAKMRISVMSSFLPNKSIDLKIVKEFFNISAPVTRLAESLTNKIRAILPRRGFRR